jgi:hypothetical protein
VLVVDASLLDDVLAARESPSLAYQIAPSVRSALSKTKTS